MTEIRDQLQTALAGTYTIDRELGGGGMSRVFVATETSLSRQVVIKVLPPELSGGVNLERFRREISVVAQLQHPNIVPVLSAGELEGLPYFTMPYVAGLSLRARLASGELPLADVLWILRDVAKALGYAHKHGVVHRDIKPDNVLLNEDAAVVTDFGVAKALTAASARGAGTMTSLGVALGTPAYMSPEQAAAAPTVDHRADIYALGVVAYEMIAGHTPFAGRSPQQMLAAHSVEMPEPVAKLRPAVSPALASLVMRCLEKSPADRPQTVDSLLQELSAIATPSGGTVPHVAVTPPPTRAWRAPRRALGAAAVVALAATGAYLAMRGPGTPVDAQVIAVFPFRVTSSDQSLQYLREAMADLMSMKLAGDSGLRASDLRAVMAAYARAGGSELSSAQLTNIARQLGAGQFIAGEIVGTRESVVINASLVPLGLGGVIRRTVQGSPDSISALVDVLTAQLLSLRAGENEDRLAVLSRIQLPALRAYLQGMSAYRRGHYADARAAFARALEVEPEFLQAMIALYRADGWAGDFGRRERLRPVIWRRRDELPRAERAVIVAEMGERTPGYTPIAVRLAAAERATQAAWDNVDAWHTYADLLFHYGAVMGVPDGLQRAVAAWNRALTIDSTFRPAVEHLPVAYHHLGDTAGRRRATLLSLSLDSIGGRAVGARWFQAMATNDRRTLRALKLEDEALPPVGIAAANTGMGVAFVDSLWERVDREVVLPAERRGLAGFRRQWMAAMGRPHEAGKDLDILAADTNATDWRPLHALFWDADSSDGARGVTAIRTRIAQAGPPRRLAREVPELLGLALWGVEWRQDDIVREAVQRLRTIAAMPDTLPGQASAALILLTVEAALAQRDRRADIPAVAARLDSASMQMPTGMPLVAAANLVSARAWERAGNLPNALGALRRRERHFSVVPPFLTTFLREEGRLATSTGDREGAISAFELYLALRFRPEPSLMGEVERIRGEVDRLKRESAGR